MVDPGGQAINATDRLYLAAAVPTLIVWGDADPIIPVAHAYAAHEAMPDSGLEIFEGVGHYPQVEQPERFVSTLCPRRWSAKSSTRMPGVYISGDLTGIREPWRTDQLERCVGAPPFAEV